MVLYPMFLLHFVVFVLCCAEVLKSVSVPLFLVAYTFDIPSKKTLSQV